MAAEIGTNIRKVQTPDGVIHPIYDERIPAVDTTPTSGSTNVVTSGGVHSAIQSAVSSVYKYKGTKASYASLPSSGNVTGDVWNVEAAYGDYPAGTNWAWTGSGWDALSGEVDLSAYLTKTDASSTYATKTQLTNGSVTKLGTATVGGTTKPIYLNAGTPAALSATVGSSTMPVYLNAGAISAITSFSEAYLSWGGKNFSAAYGPIDAAMVSELGACRTMFAKAAGIVVEYSTDGGETWLDYGLTDSQKVGLFSSGQSVNTGKNTIAGGASPNNMLRVSLRTQAAGIYTSLNKFVLYVSTNGSTGSYCTIRCRTQQNYEDNIDTWVVRADHVGISGWNGWNVINIDATTTYGNSKASQYGEWQFIFGYTGASASYAGLIVMKIFGFGGTGWTTPSNMAKTGHLYSFDSLQNAYFPAKVAPSANGLGLGYDGRRWELYATTGNFSGNITTAGYVAVGTGRSNGSYIGSDASTNIFFHNSAGFPLIADGLVVRRGMSASTATLGSTTYPWGGVYSTSFIKSGGTSSQFLKADGSVDSNTYALASAIPTIDVTPTASSTNAVSSGGVYTAINDAQVWEAGSGSNSATLKGSEGTAAGNYSTVEGYKSETGGTYTSNNISISGHDGTNGSYSHAEGLATIASGPRGAHAEGAKNLASGAAAHAEGGWNKATGQFSHAEGYLTTASNESSHAEGGTTVASGIRSHAEGRETIASGQDTHAEGRGAVASGSVSHAEGAYTKATNDAAHSEGYGTIASGDAAHSEGKDSIATGNYSHAEGHSVAKGIFSHSENGDKGMEVWPVGSANATTYTSTFDEEWRSVRTAVGDTVFANIIKSSEIELKSDSTALPIKITDASYSGDTLTFSTESTLSTTALSGSTEYWINMSVAYGARSHSENMGNTSYGEGSHAEGEYTVALGNYSHVEGSSTLAQNSCEHAEGNYNVSNKASDTYGNAGNTQHSIGIGTSSARKNAVEVMQNGDMYVIGVGNYDGTNFANADTLQESIPSVDNAPTSGSSNAVSSGGVYTAIQNASPGTLDTTSSISQSTNASESLSGNIRLHKIAKTGSNDDLIDAPWKFDERGPSSVKNNIYVDGWRGTTNGYYSTSEGYNCDTGGTATANMKGYNQSNIEGRCAHAEGNSTIAKGSDSHSEGLNTFAEGWASHAEGLHTEARGYGSHAEGQYTIAYGSGGHAQGRYNLSTRTSTTFGDAGNTLHSIGIGTSENDRKNAVEVMQNGDVYVYGIGNYDGSNYSSASTLQASISGNFVPKSGTTTMSDDAVLSFPSEDWDEQNDTGYKTEISKGGIHCYDPDDGFELHIDSTNGAFINGNYSGQNTQYGNGGLSYKPSSSSNTYSYLFPSKSGTFAMTSDIPAIPAYAQYPFCIMARTGQDESDLNQIEVAPFNIRTLEESTIHDGRPVFLVIDASTTIDCPACVLQLSYCDLTTATLEFSDYARVITLEYDPADADSSYTIDSLAITVSVRYPLAAKQNIISDLSTIRSGAALGTTSLQPGDVPTFHTGTSDPASSLGSDGDIYLKLSS